MEGALAAGISTRIPRVLMTQLVTPEVLGSCEGLLLSVSRTGTQAGGRGAGPSSIWQLFSHLGWFAQLAHVDWDALLCPANAAGYGREAHGKLAALGVMRHRPHGLVWMVEAAHRGRRGSGPITCLIHRVDARRAPATGRGP